MPVDIGIKCISISVCTADLPCFFIASISMIPN